MFLVTHPRTHIAEELWQRIRDLQKENSILSKEIDKKALAQEVVKMQHNIDQIMLLLRHSKKQRNH
jgi:hypothetical protein